MLKELTVKASIQLPVDPFDAAAVLTRAEPIIKQVAELMATISGASVCTTFDGRSAIKGAFSVSIGAALAFPSRTRDSLRE